MAHAIAFGRAICGDLAGAERREWLVTNGIGGFASGTIAGTLTRRYHGLLVAALNPPRRANAARHETRRARALRAAPSTPSRRTAGRTAASTRRAGAQIERFYLDGTMPVWHYALGDALLEKRVWMEPGANVDVRALSRRCGPPRRWQSARSLLRQLPQLSREHARRQLGDVA